MNKYITKANPTADTFEYVAYDLNGITYVPHFRNKNLYVGPGYPRQNLLRYTDLELQLRGAKPRVEMLWQRGDSDRVTDSNP
jgi:hypothetical protein